MRAVRRGQRSRGAAESAADVEDAHAGTDAGQPRGTADAIPPYFAPRIIMGDALDPILRAGHRNREQARIVSIQAILERL